MSGVLSGLVLGHDHQWVTDRIAVGGGVWLAEQVVGLQREGITHVIDCRSEATAEMLYRDTGVELFCCRTDDDGKPKPDAWFERGTSYAIDVLCRPDTKLLCHCAGGLNRGPSMAYAILRVLEWTPGEAWRAIKFVRPAATIRYANDADKWFESRGTP